MARMMLLAQLMVLIWTLGSAIADSFLRCCGDDALSCLKSHHRARQTSLEGLRNLPDKKFTMFTYDTKNILNYALYSFAVNSVYAQHRGYNLVSTTSENGFEFEPGDQRWNKVKIMEEFVAALSHKATPDEDRYLVWLDSDLVVLNFNVNLSDIVAQHPHADLLISADVEPLNGMVNTGCMIVRVSEWSRLFFREWWNATERVNGMDQHVFDLIYQRRKVASKQPGYKSTKGDYIESKIVILATHALNSHIPASRHQQPYHNILHLAGESSAVRAFIFKAAFAEVCRAHQLSTPADSAFSIHLKPQLGLSRQFLQNIDYDAVLYEAVHSVWREMQNINASISDNTGDAAAHDRVCDISAVLQLRSRLRDAMQSRDLIKPTSDVHNVYLEALRWAVHAHTYLNNEYTLTTSTTTTNTESDTTTSTHGTIAYSPQTHLEHLQYLLDASFELLTVDKELPSVQKTLSDMVGILNLILVSFMGDDNPSQGPMLYYQFKYFDFLATYYALLHMPHRELESLQQARATWEKMFLYQYFGTGNTVSDPYRALADLLARMAALECRDGVHYSDIDGGRFERGLELVLESVRFTAQRWLPVDVYDSISQYTAPSTTSTDTEQPTYITRTTHTSLPILLIDKAHLPGVPIKIISTLVQNYALAAQCARRLSEARENRVLFDVLGGMNDSSVIENGASERYEHVGSKLCEILYSFGYECVYVGSTLSVRARVIVHDKQDGNSPGRSSDIASVKSEAGAPKRVVRLKRKQKR